MNLMLDAALELASKGVPVFPCAPNLKTPLSKNGFYDATTDEKTIRNWWKWQPDANLAMPTGHPGFDVPDVDVRSNGSGLGALSDLTEAGYLTGAVRAVRTPSNGIHIYFPGSHRGNGSLPKVHLDFRGLGGYVLVPPSHVITDSYEGDYVELQSMTPDFPESLNWDACKAFLLPAPKVVRSLSAPTEGMGGLIRFMERQSEGNRNNALYWAARRACESGAGDLSELEARAVGTGLDEVAVRKTLQSAAKGLTRSG